MMRPLRLFLCLSMATLGAFAVLCLLHAPLLRLPYFWDEAGYYIPAALDFYRQALWIPRSTLPTGHTPLLSVYLGLAWRLFGFSPLVTRAALILVAALTVVALCILGRRVVQGEAKCEIVLWSASLLALSPLFFAQSSLAHLEILVTLFTTLGIIALLRERMLTFVLVSSLAILSKETAVIFLPVAWLFAWYRRREKRSMTWIALTFPLLPLLVWALYYHHATGYWTGNAEYLQYNLYSTLSPVRIFLTLLRRIQELLLAGSNWVLLLAAGLGLWKSRAKGEEKGKRGDRIGRKREDAERAGSKGAGEPPLTHSPRRCEKIAAMVAAATKASAFPAQQAQQGRNRQTFELSRPPESRKAFRIPQGGTAEPLQPSRDGTSAIFSHLPSPGLDHNFVFLAIGLCAVYVSALSLVGGAILPRYLLPVFPVFYLVVVALIFRLPKALARTLCVAAAACLVGSWFINPPYPFPFEDNLAYADFVRLHQQAARFLEKVQGNPLILTAWPASGELSTPALGYVNKPVRVTTVQGFTAEDFASTKPEAFDLLYLYSRKWEPENNWLARSTLLREIQRRYFGYTAQVPDHSLVDRYHLRLLRSFERRGQWVRIYAGSRQ